MSQRSVQLTENITEQSGDSAQTLVSRMLFVTAGLAAHLG